MVRLAHAVPDAFPAGAPLSVDEALDALRDSWFVPALARAAAAREEVARAAPAGHGPQLWAGPSVLSWEGVSVNFDGNHAVDDVTLAVEEGEWVALIGANGSGKSTLTGLTVGLTAPSSGIVRFRGSPIRPGRVFEHAANVALLRQPVPCHARRPGARRRGSHGILRLPRPRARQPVGAEPGRQAAPRAGRDPGRGAGRPRTRRADHRAGRRPHASLPPATRPDPGAHRAHRDHGHP